MENKILNKEVEIDLAKLLKEKGFDEPCDSWFYSDGTYHDNPTEWKNSELAETNYSRPTISEVVDWIFQKYNIWIYATIFNTPTQFYCEGYYKINDEEDKLVLTGKHSHTPSAFNSLSEAYEATITYVLTNK